MPRLRLATSPSWIEVVLEDFDSFLVDHAACERKASATALKLVSHYSDRTLLVRELIPFAQEELDHYAQVMKIILERGLETRADEKDPYVGALMQLIKRGPEQYFLDRLLVLGVVEARGCERFGLVADALEPGALKDFYVEITRSEARHHGLFVRLAKEYFPTPRVQARLDELLDAEAKIVSELPHRPAVH
ncbi:MAG TPA: tRNA-(ms[2]io[6]A)-hydroxylase [Polyangiales bacterium]|jgi:tRNA-(ms[2]io[6]A)-hydroxylase|nr:tRNA-(ms[2]io[6]A)-hydroxylase [Polyangiales bacterium]